MLKRNNDIYIYIYHSNTERRKRLSNFFLLSNHSFDKEVSKRIEVSAL